MIWKSGDSESVPFSKDFPSYVSSQERWMDGKEFKKLKN
jgi:hypothetical protein